LLDHGGRVTPEIDGVGEPGDGEFEFALGGRDIERGVGVIGVDGVSWGEGEAC